MPRQLSYLAPPQGQVVGLKWSCLGSASPMLGEAGTTDDVGPGLATHQVLLKVYISSSPESCAMMQVLDYSFYR